MDDPVTLAEKAMDGMTPADVLDALDREQPPWAGLCDLAECAPDFPVLGRFNEDQAVAWLVARLARKGYEAPYAVVQMAYREWPPDTP
jgi:hypothetical protein